MKMTSRHALEAGAAALRYRIRHGDSQGVLDDMQWEESVQMLDSLAAKDGWLPIESAPKDGTRVLLATPEGIWIGHWTTCRGESWWSPWPSVPTRWMPLPEAPDA